MLELVYKLIRGGNKMIGLIILLTIAVILVLYMYTFILVEMIQSIRYNRFDKGINIVSFVVMTIIILSGILTLLGI